jgi:hypothetical protein
MEAVIAIVKNLLKNNRVVFVLGVLLGLALGITFAWGIWPVEVVDTSPDVLRFDLQQDYLRMTIDSYNKNGDIDAAIRRWDSLGVAAGPAFISLRADPGNLTLAEVDEFGLVVQAVKGAPIQNTTSPQDAPGATDSPTSNVGQFVLYGAIAVVVVLVLVGALYLFRLFRKGSGTVTPVMEANKLNKSIERTDYQQHGLEPPITQSLTTYVYGYDLYDESFSIDTEAGKYLGEFGVGICEKIGVGEPKKVTALEIWLFEENDIKTATKVLMSDHAFNNSEIRGRLEAKGELILLQPKEQILLETANLQLLATVVDLEYGMGSMPQNSYFQRVTLEFAVWPRAKK